MQQLTLFDRAHARRTDPITSHQAARRVEPGLDRLEALVLTWLREADLGATTKELSAILNLDRVTVSPRLKPLPRKGFIVASPERRDGGIVWKAVL